MSDFIHFSELCADDPSSWRGRRILSIDVDWASDEVLGDTVDLIESAGVKATFFVTHDTQILSRLRGHPLIELGLHPNFDPLIRGEVDAPSAADILEALKCVVPEAKVLRSHAMTTSGRWMGLFESQGIRCISNYLMYGQCGIAPFRQINGILEAPVYFADDGLLYQRRLGKVTFDVGQGFSPDPAGLQVFNFHPIHVFLNCEALDRYTLARPHLRNTAALLALRHNGDGVRQWITRLIWAEQ